MKGLINEDSRISNTEGNEAANDNVKKRKHSKSSQKRNTLFGRETYCLAILYIIAAILMRTRS
jgi:hypothetical protein